MPFFAPRADFRFARSGWCCVAWSGPWPWGRRHGSACCRRTTVALLSGEIDVVGFPRAECPDAADLRLDWLYDHGADQERC
jgi:hypothetical protein